MKNGNVFLVLGAMMLTISSFGQQLLVKDKLIKVEELPEYIVLNCDNNTGILSRTIRIEIQARNSANAIMLNELQNVLENKNYLGISNQTDLLNTMAKLGFDYLNAFPQNDREDSATKRSAIVFRKKEKYRN